MPETMCEFDNCPLALSCGRTRFTATAKYPQTWAKWTPDAAGYCFGFLDATAPIPASAAHPSHPAGPGE